MTLYLLDTDIVSLLQDGNSNVIRNISAHSPDEIATSIVTVEEQLSAWYTLLRRAKSPQALVPIYTRMTATVMFLRRLTILTFNDAAAGCYEQFRRQKPRLGRMDVRIASIAAAYQAVVVTRNVVDFQQLSGITIEDWAAA